MSRRGDPYTFGKAVSGGTPLTDRELAQATSDQIASMKMQLSRPAPTRTMDILMLRLAEELDYAHRLLDGVETEMARRAALGDGPLRRQVSEAHEIVADVAAIVAADDRQAAVAYARSEDVRRRLLRGSVSARFEDYDDGGGELPISKS